MSEQDAVVTNETPEAEVTDDALAQALVESETEEAGTEPEADELEETEFEGKKVKVTKGFKDALLREADYRQKTHTIGEERRKIEADRAALAEERKMASEFDDERTELRSIEKKLAEYDKVSPEQWLAQKAKDRAEGTTIAEDGQFEEAQLRKAREKLLGSMQTKYQTIQQSAKQRQEAWEAENTKAITARIKDWSPEKEQAIKSTVAQKFGFSQDDLKGVKDARILAVMDYVHRQDQALEKARAKLAAVQAEREPPPAPVARVRGNNAPAMRGATADTLKRSAAAFDAEIMKVLYPKRA
jgi:hypothetical protein